MSVKSTTTTVTACDGCGFTINRNPEEGWVRIVSHWGNVFVGGTDNSWIACSFECAAVTAGKIRRIRRQGFRVVGEMGNLDSLIEETA